jgi:hypothetical protein
MDQFWFRTAMFAVDPKEDEETNPFCYGRELAQWLKQKFDERGYTTEPVIPEDFGWCVILSRRDGLLFVGCGNVRSELLESVPPAEKAGFRPDGAAMTWTAFVATDKPGWSLRFTQRRASLERLAQAAATAEVDLAAILGSESRIALVDEP